MPQLTSPRAAPCNDLLDLKKKRRYVCVFEIETSELPEEKGSSLDWLTQADRRILCLKSKFTFVFTLPNIRRRIYPKATPNLRKINCQTSCAVPITTVHALKTMVLVAKITTLSTIVSDNGF